MLPSLLAVTASFVAPQQSPATAAFVGRVRVERPVAAELRLLAWRLPDGAPARSGRLDARLVFERRSEVAGVAGADGAFAVDAPAGSYALFAFADVDGDGRWTPAVPEPCGWLACVDAPTAGAGVELSLRAPTPLPREDRVVAHGALRWRHGYPIVQLRGNANERGRAHGELLAPQIVDFFRCYVLEERLGSAAAYGEFAAFLARAFAWPEPFLAEVDAVLAGMQASGADLFVPELGRAFGRTELLAINAYIETRAMRSSCTQFVCWGDRTRGTDVDGGTIAGRNMDGEIDLRRVTVSHFVLFAVAPSEPGQHRFVSMMWPGFVGTLSGCNDAGVHCMENAGGTGPGPVVERLQPIGWTMREALARFDGAATPASFERLLAQHANAAGGACGPGCIVVFALPSSAGLPGWVLEGDRFGHATRRPGDVAPFVPSAVMASNHHLVYGADPERSGRSFGREPSPSSAWRYEAGRHKLEAWARVGRAIGTAEMRELLQTVAHGTTEHSIVTRPDAREFDVAVASLQAEPWDAPYRQWTTFRFDELFAAGDAGAAGR